jgi:hypothetical protein
MVILPISCLAAPETEWQALISTNDVKAVLDDGEFLWLGTEGGLLHFHKNGSVVERFLGIDFGLPTSQVTCLARNADGRLFNQGAAVTFSFDESERLSEKSLSVYNTLGQLVECNELSALAPGEHTLRFEGKDAEGEELPSGIYIFQLMIGEYCQSLKATLFK